jgi:hypothetical protein
MAIATGLNKTVALKKETTFGVAAGTGSALYLRRLTSDIGLKKDTYESAEIVTHDQVQDFRHGIRRILGTINGELSPGSYNLLMQSALRKDFVAGATTGAIITVTAAVGPPGTFTRSAGSYLTDGFKVGDVVRWTGWTTGGAANNSRNYRITVLTALVMTTTGTGDEVVAAKAAGDSVTCTVSGKKSFIPATAQTNDSYTIEQNFPDIVQSEQYLGCKFGGMQIKLPATGLATIAFPVTGQDIVTSTSAYFVTPGAAGTQGIAAAVNGSLRVGGVDIATVTGLDINLDLGLFTDAVVGSNKVPSINPARSRVSGQLTAMFEDAVLRDLFINETEVALTAVLELSTGIAAEFLAFNLPRIKLGAADKDDGEKNLIQTLSFVALYNSAGGAGISSEQTTLSVQDSTI